MFCSSLLHFPYFQLLLSVRQPMLLRRFYYLLAVVAQNPIIHINGFIYKNGCTIVFSDLNIINKESHHEKDDTQSGYDHSHGVNTPYQSGSR
jgi:hypothetical protein